MAHSNYEDAIKGVYRGLILLGVVTLIEVAISLLGKGHLGIEPGTILVVVCGVLITVLSLYKAYFIIYEFMHMGHEAKGLAMTVLLPVLLLVWAVIAFFQEGDSWKNRRDKVKQANEAELETEATGMYLDEETIELEAAI